MTATTTTTATAATVGYPLAERRLIGSLLRTGDLAVLGDLGPDDFVSDSRLVLIVGAARELAEQDQPIDAVSVDRHLVATGRTAAFSSRSTGPCLVDLLAEAEPPLAGHDRALLLEAASRRALIKLGERTIQAAQGEHGPVDLQEMLSRFALEAGQALSRMREAQ